MQPKNISDVSLKKSFFYRTYSLWNTLPLEIREIEFATTFKNEVIKYFWKVLFIDNIEDHEMDVYLSDND